MKGRIRGQMIAPPGRAPGLRVVMAFAAIAFGARLMADSEDPLVSVSSGIVSRHVYRGVERSGAAWQMGLDGAVRGWRGQFWSSRPFDSSDLGELNSTLGYVWSVTKDLSVEASGTHFWYVDSSVVGGAAHSFEANLRMTWLTRQQVRWVLESGYDIRFHSLATEGSLQYDLPLPHWGTYLQGRVYVGHVRAKDVLPEAAGAGVSDAYAYWGADLRLPYRISWHTTLAMDAHYTEAAGVNRYWSPSLAGPGRRAWLGLSATYEF
ncbi:MAG TPA: hypothetical protein VG734_04265 [Lacunisphaera sp.]|nr:hypothetical protein [Lacunisphaera sp.]